MSEIAFTPVEWQATSIRHLNLMHPEYTRPGKKSWAEKLLSALAAMSYMEAEYVVLGKMSKDDWISSLRERIASWTKADHDSMKKFLEDGGYAHAVKTLTGTLPTFPVKTSEGTEEIEIQFDDAAIAELEGTLSPKSQHSPDHELEEIIAEAAAEADPRYKVW